MTLALALVALLLALPLRVTRSYDPFRPPPPPFPRNRLLRAGVGEEAVDRLEDRYSNEYDRRRKLLFARSVTQAPDSVLRDRFTLDDGDDLGGMTIGELKPLLEARGLPLGGTKPELIARLTAAREGSTTAAADARQQEAASQPSAPQTAPEPPAQPETPQPAPEPSETPTAAAPTVAAEPIPASPQEAPESSSTAAPAPPQVQPPDAAGTAAPADASPPEPAAPAQAPPPESGQDMTGPAPAPAPAESGAEVTATDPTQTPEATPAPATPAPTKEARRGRQA